MRMKAAAAAEPTDRQSEVLAEVRRYWREYGRPPSVRDLMPRVRVTTPQGVVCHLSALAAKGLIEWARDGTSRAVWPAGLRQRIAEMLADHDPPTA